MDIFSLHESESPSFFKRLLNCAVTGCLVIIIFLFYLFILSFSIAKVKEFVTSIEFQSSDSQQYSTSSTQSATSNNRSESRFTPMQKTPFNCFLKLDETTKRVLYHPKMNTDFQQELEVREQLSQLRIQAINIRENCIEWGTKLCKTNSDKYLKDCQLAVTEQSSLLESLDQVRDYSLN